MTFAAEPAIVLIVEDEPLLLILAIDIVEDAGFAALSAQNADAAIGIMESRNDVSIMLTDINMPGTMDGVRLAHLVSGRWPPVKIVVTSGKGLPHLDSLPLGSQFLPKPYAAATISKVLHDLVA